MLANDHPARRVRQQFGRKYSIRNGAVDLVGPAADVIQIENELEWILAAGGDNVRCVARRIKCSIER